MTPDFGPQARDPGLLPPRESQPTLTDILTAELRLGLRPRVLLVEDDRAGREMYAVWLTQAGFDVDQAHNGLQALERAFERLPDIVVTDLNIPGIDGFELTRRLKLDSRTSRVPVVAVTGYAAFTADPGRAQRAGCDAVLEKPCSAEDLESTIRTFISGNGSEGR